MTLILRADNLTIIKWWGEVSYATHMDMRGHNGATMYFGIGSVAGIANNHRINGKS